MEFSYVLSRLFLGCICYLLGWKWGKGRLQKWFKPSQNIVQLVFNSLLPVSPCILIYVPM